MRFQVIATVLIACCLSILGWVITPSAEALTQIQLTDLSYTHCSEEMSEGLVTPGGSTEASCFLIVGKAVNKSGKPVLNADIYGFIYDANDDPVMQNRGRVGSIDEVPPGISDFEIRISVPANQPTPLKLERFKASGFTGRVRR